MTTYALTLIAGAGSQPLLAAHVDRVCAQLDIDCTPDWLGESEACDLIFTSELCAADITAQAMGALQGTDIDAVCTPAQNRRKPILISDMDSTIINQECIDELGDAIGIGPQIRKITQAVIDARIGFPEALRQPGHLYRLIVLIAFYR